MKDGLTKCTDGNGNCVPDAFYCDSIVDCTDGSDENRCTGLFKLNCCSTSPQSCVKIHEIFQLSETVSCQLSWTT